MIDFSRLPDDARLAACEESLVFAESFAPRAVLGSVVPDDSPFMNALAQRCDPVITAESKMHWALQSDVRSAALQRLAERGELSARMIQATVLANGFGLWMLRLLQQEEIDLEALSIGEQSELRIAAQFVDRYLPAGMRERFDSQLELAQTKRDLRLVVPSGLVGREALLRKMMRRVSATPPENEANVVLVTGVGGSGKSALLAEFMLRQGEVFDCPTICLDFDSPNLTVPVPERLMLLFARQMAMHYPEYAGSLRGFARELEFGLIHGQGRLESFQKLAFSTSVVHSIWRKFCGECGLEVLPIILVLDTFEEILVRGAAEGHLVEQWVYSLVEDYGFRHLSLVVSGRTLSDGLFHQVSGRQAMPLKIGDLTRPAAAKFLRLQAGGRLTGEQAKIFVGRHGGNPLLLRLLGRLIREGEQDLRSDHLEHKVAQRFLYDRILKRIRTNDPAVADLAHPGLVLRRISPRIIQEVLAEPLGLAPMSRERAGALFDELSRQVWLVEATSTAGVLVHRKDLRRLMLKFMYQTDRLDQLDAVHRAAVEYYSNGRAEEFDSVAARLEANYHLLFLQDPQLEQPEAMHLVRSLGADIECLPVARSAKLRLQAQIDLTDAELATLSSDERESELDRQRSRLYKVASVAYAASPMHYAAENLDRPRMSDADIELAFANGDWHAITSSLVDFFSPDIANEVGYEKNTLLQSSLWKVCLACLFDSAADESTLAFARRALDDQASSRGDGPYARTMSGYSKLTLREAFHAAAGLLRRGRQQRFNATWVRENTLYGADEVRLWLLAPLAPAVRRSLSIGLRVNPEVFRFLSDEFQKASQEFTAGLGADLLQWGRMAGNRMSTDRSVSTLASLTRENPVAPWPTGAGAIYRLGGLMLPELYPLCLQALRAVPEPILLHFADEQMRSNRLWPGDVAQADLARLLRRDPESGISVLIEVADRFGRVPELLRLGISNVSDDMHLRTALQAWRRLERRLFFDHPR